MSFTIMKVYRILNLSIPALREPHHREVSKCGTKTVHAKLKPISHV